MKREEILSKKYKKSIIIDLAVLMFLLFSVFIIMTMFGQEVMNYYPIPFVILIFLYYFLGDKIFGNKSLGKKILKIQVLDMNGNFPSLRQIMYRRFLEFLNYDLKFIMSSCNIDEKTKTKIDHDI